MEVLPTTKSARTLYFPQMMSSEVTHHSSFNGAVMTEKVKAHAFGCKLKVSMRRRAPAEHPNLSRDITIVRVQY